VKVKGLVIKNPKNWKKVTYEDEFDETGMNTTIPQKILDKLELKYGDSVMVEFQGKHVTTTLGRNGRIGLTRMEVNKLGYLGTS
jgi:S-adenosylmethionine hydrolase